MHINNTRCSRADNCLRRYYWSHEFHGLGISGTGIQENPAFGSLIHYALAHLYSGEGPGKSCSLAQDEWMAEYRFDELDFDQKNHWKENFDWAQRIIDAYHTWRATTDDFEVLQIETEGSVRLGEICYKCGLEYDSYPACIHCGAETHSYVFRVDLAVVRNGGIYIIDHKTTSSSSDTYLAQWHYSMQLLGYAYGYGKALGADVSGTCANIIRKLKRIGVEGADLKQCPTCRGGSKKRPTCEVCSGTGKVEREKKPNDSAFVREWESFNEDDVALFVRSRLRTIENILTERKRFKTEPDAAWPMNPSNCFSMGRCPFVNLCWRGDAETWYDPPDEMLQGFVDNGEDYVSEREMVREELK
jgi:hypothetical protein